MTKYTQITPADGWYFVHENVGATPYTLHRVVVWALCEESDVIGLIAINGLPDENGNAPKLVPPPPVKGCYLHKSELTSEQADCLPQ